MNKNSSLDKFLEFFLTRELRHKLTYLPLHIKNSSSSSDKKTKLFIDSINEIASESNINEEFFILLDGYVETSKKEDFEKLNDFVSSYYQMTEKEIYDIPTSLNKAYDSLRALIEIEAFKDEYQVYDAIVLLKEEISRDLIKKIIVHWKKEEKVYKDEGEPYGKKFLVSYDFMEDIDSVSLYRFKENFNIQGFDSTFKEVKRDLEERLWEFMPPENSTDGVFDIWLIDRIPNFLNDFNYLSAFLENIVKEQNPEGYWENKNVIKSKLVDPETNKVKKLEYGINTSGTALCSLILIKHSNSDMLKQKGILGAKWLLEQQNSDGSWFDEVGSNGITKKKSLFVTILALETLIRSGISNIEYSIELANEWIMSKQNKLGMWEDDKFKPLFRYSSFPLMTILVLELEHLLKFRENLQTIESELPVKTSQMIRTSNYDYDIAVSFAGENRDIVEKYVSLLKSISVFYDEDEIDKLWGVNLLDKLYEIYTYKARFCVMFISKHYAEKIWTNHERQAAQERALKSLKDKIEYILPVKLDDTEIPGMPSTIGYVDLRKKTIEELAEITIKKLSKK